jgi:hypothetical protein
MTKKASGIIGGDVLEWLLPAPHEVEERGALGGVRGFDARFFGFREAADLGLVFEEAGLGVEGGWPLDVVHIGGLGEAAGVRSLTVGEAEVLKNFDEGYLLEVEGGRGVLVAGGYRGAVHGIERLRQWMGLPGGRRRAFTLLDFPVLGIRAVNRDDAEDWSHAYWDRTIAHARAHFFNMAGFSVENAMLALARGDMEEYGRLTGIFRAIRDKARRAGVTLAPMVYNIDFFVGLFLQAAGREDLTVMRDRVNVRYDLPGAWEEGARIMVQGFADLEPGAFCLWLSEAVHERHGEPGLPEDEQFGKDAAFMARVICGVAERVPGVRLFAIMSQGVREHIPVFTGACAGLPVVFVHYDGEWTYHCAPPRLTLHGVRRSLQSGRPWVCKPAWVRVIYNGMPIIRPSEIQKECMEIIHEGYEGIFPNASRWETVPWNMSVGAAFAWGGDRADLETVLGRVLAASGDGDVPPDLLLEVEQIWRRMNLINTPLEGSPRYSPFRSLVHKMLRFVERASADPAFANSDFEEAWITGQWQTHAAWLRATTRRLEEMTAWHRQRKNPGPWATATLAILPALLDLHSHTLASAYLVCREASPDNAKGVWRAWRPLLRFHIERAASAMDHALAFTPLDGQMNRREGTAFTHPSTFPRTAGWTGDFATLKNSCAAILGAIDDPAAFSGLKAAPGFEGFWPREGLFSVLRWPVVL